MTGLVAPNAADFAQLITNLAPTGDAWPTEPDAVQQQVYQALAQTWKRLNDRCNYLVTDAFPATTEELLPEWEQSLGLPDPCAGPDATIAQRQAHVVARLTFRGGQSVAFFVGFAAALGFPITITQYAPARADSLVADGPCYDLVWQFYWQVSAPSVETYYFSADTSFADDPLATYSSGVLACELLRLAPARTTVGFAYS